MSASLRQPPTWTSSALRGDRSVEHLVIVVDACVLANALADDEDDGDTARYELRAAGEVAAPDLVDVETVSVLRKRWLRRTLTDQRFATAIAHLQQLDFERVPALRLVRAPSSCGPTSAPTTRVTSHWPSGWAAS